MPFRSPRQRRAVMSKLRGRSMFFPARHPSVAAIISLRSPETARAAVAELRKAVARGRFSALTVKRSMVLASNRAEASKKRVKAPLSERERREMTEVAKIYREAAGRL